MTACPASAYLYNHKQKYCGTVTPTTHLLDISQLPVQALSSRGLTKRAVSQEKKKKGFRNSLSYASRKKFRKGKRYASYNENSISEGRVSIPIKAGLSFIYRFLFVQQTEWTQDHSCLSCRCLLYISPCANHPNVQSLRNI